MIDFFNSFPNIENKKIGGWGRRNFVNSKLTTFENSKDLKNFILRGKELTCITRGLGRSYGDAAQLKEDFVLNLKYRERISICGNEVTVGSWIPIDELLRLIIPLGFFLPVSPGSSKVSIGGAIAADTHGKNHDKKGSIGNHITKILLCDARGKIQTLRPKIEKTDDNNDLFWATIGGMGLTGIIIEATISLIKIETSFMKVDTYVCDELNSLMNLMKNKNKQYAYSVAWIDSMHDKFRGVLTCANHAKKEDLKLNRSNLLIYDDNTIANTPKFLPDGILNRFTVKTFNEIWFRKSSIRKKSLKTISQFFYPLDAIQNWNRIYGSHGFYQYQFVVPFDKAFFIYKALRKLKEYTNNSFLAVLKIFGNANHSFLSFPQPGWTLSIDLPASNSNLTKVLDQLDEELASLGGKIYLAKDLRQNSEIFKKTYPLYPKWRSVKSQMDPENIFQSDLSKRLKI